MTRRRGLGQCVRPRRPGSRPWPGLRLPATRLRRAVLGLVLVGVVCGTSWAGVAAATAGPPVRIAVAPFVGERPGLPVADALADRLARRPIERLIAPDAFVARPDFDVRAAEVRQWAYNAAVDAVVVGRLVPGEGAEADAAPVRVEAALRSGHSGAELARHAVPLDGSSGLGAAVETLAASLLEDLGFREPVGPSAARPAPDSEASGVRGGAAGPGAGGDDAARGRGLDPRLDLSGVRGNEPIAIQAEEAEIVDRGDQRRIVFQRNVHVQQGAFSVRSDRLEAEYRRGDSEPTRLVAQGSVRVDQGDRRAECDRAVYERASERIVCEGRAELTQGCDVVRGRRIEFDLARDRARVEGAASIVIRSPEDTAESGAAPAPCEEEAERP